MGIDDSSGDFTNETSINSVNGVREELNGVVNYYGNFTEGTTDVRNTLFDAYFKYDNDITEGLNLRGTLGYSYQKFENKTFTAPPFLTNY